MMVAMQLQAQQEQAVVVAHQRSVAMPLRE
jgi:hypothetical protein